MKQISYYNTWIGSVVGAIPPIAGYTAMTNTIDINCIFLGLVLYCWQFPHFNSLSWLLNESYTKAGIKMMSNNDISLMKRVTMRYSILLTIICAILPYFSNNISIWFSLYSLIPNIMIILFSKNFCTDLKYKDTMNLFKMSLIQLFIIMALLILLKENNK